MKTTEEKLAEKIIYVYLKQKTLNPYTKLKVDKRTKVGKLALEMVYKIEMAFNFKEVKQKRINRNKLKFKNILQNPIVKDYINNKPNIKQVLTNGIVFYGGRNHWAKNEKDLRILKILQKMFHVEQLGGESPTPHKIKQQNSSKLKTINKGQKVT